MSTWTQADIDALKVAIKSGTLRVKYADREVTYHSLTDMRSLLAEMVADVGAAAGNKPYILATHSKGLD